MAISGFGLPVEAEITPTLWEMAASKRADGVFQVRVRLVSVRIIPHLLRRLRQRAKAADRDLLSDFVLAIGHIPGNTQTA